MGGWVVKPYSKAVRITEIPFCASCLMKSFNVRWMRSFKPGVVLACSHKYVEVSTASAPGGKVPFSLEKFRGESSRAGMTVSPIAIRVVHCDGVSTSPSGGGGSGDARGAIKLICWLVIANSGYDLGSDISMGDVDR